MVSRRTFLGGAALTLAAGAFAGRSAGAPRTPDTVRVRFENATGTAYAYITGTTPDGKPALIKGDGTVYYPPSPAEHAPIAEDCSIVLSDAAELAVPKLDAGRIYVVLGDKLDFFVNPGPALVHPSFLDPGDPNHARDWSFCEFTFNDTQLYANISYVDFVAVPLGLGLTTSGSGEQEVRGLPAGSLGPVSEQLRGQDGPWGSLVETADDGRVLRAVGAQHRAGEFADYLDDYIGRVWERYASRTLTVDSQDPGLGRFTGKVEGGVLAFDNGERFEKPVTADVFSCASGPFALGEDAGEARKSIVPRLAAALNRTTLLDDPNQPTGEDPAKFYRQERTNHYARIVHGKLPDDRGYAFPYDDVTPGPDFSGAVQAGDPDTLTVTVRAPR